MLEFDRIKVSLIRYIKSCKEHTLFLDLLKEKKSGMIWGEKLLQESAMILLLIGLMCLQKISGELDYKKS